MSANPPKAPATVSRGRTRIGDDWNPPDCSSLPFAELFRDPRLFRSDARLLRRAVREGWDVPPAAQADLLARLGAVMDATLQAESELPPGTFVRLVLELANLVIDIEANSVPRAPRGLRAESGNQRKCAG